MIPSTVQYKNNRNHYIVCHILYNRFNNTEVDCRHEGMRDLLLGQEFKLLLPVLYIVKQLVWN